MTGDACLNQTPNHSSDVSEQIAAAEDIVTNMGIGSTLQHEEGLTHQQAICSPLGESSTHKHEEGVNQNSSMDIEIRNISKANLKRIDPKIRFKEADRDGEVLLPDTHNVVDPGFSSKDQGDELTQTERDMQVDKGGDVPIHLM